MQPLRSFFLQKDTQTDTQTDGNMDRRSRSNSSLDNGGKKAKKPMQAKCCFSEHKTQEARVSYRSFGTQLPKHLQITCWSFKSQFVGLIFVQLVHWTLSSTFVCPVSFAAGGVI